MTKPESGFLPSSILCHSFHSSPFAFVVVSVVPRSGHNRWVHTDGSCLTVLTTECPEQEWLAQFALPFLQYRGDPCSHPEGLHGADGARFRLLGDS